MSFPKYPECKDSGVEWLGEVPAHWDIKPLKYVATYNDEVLSESTPDDYPIKYVEISDVNEQLGITNWSEHSFSSAPSRARRILRDGDVLISTVRTYLRAIAPVVEPPGNLVGSTGFAAIRPMRGVYHSSLLGYALRAEWFISNIIARSVGVSYPAINASDLVALLLPVPPWQEQQSIAAFLDHETARIDALVEEQQRLIELLKEKRQAVISHAVTKGLDPDVPMKDSGVEWLGEVPAHWVVAPLKYLATEQVAGPYGASLTKAMYTTSGYRVYGQQQVIPNDFSLGDYYISQEKFEEMIRYQVFPGDVLFSVMGTVGKVAVVPPEVEPGIINPRLVRYRFFRRVNPDFMRLLVMSQHYQRSLQESAQGSTMEGLNMSILGDLPILLPDPEEQGEIVAWLTKESSLLEELESQAKHAMELLNERRSALISAAVTGKIDVRGWQPPTASSVLVTTQAEMV